jgi:hypothetical protein
MAGRCVPQRVQPSECGRPSGKPELVLNEIERLSPSTGGLPNSAGDRIDQAEMRRSAVSRVVCSSQ